MHQIPLFPLNTVLFPGIPLSLHIFEERYKQMMHMCIDTQQQFGVVLIHKGSEAQGPLAEPCLIGCTAQIMQVQPLSQGRMNITALGRERFRILSLSTEQPYLVGQIEYFPLAQGDPTEIRRAGKRLRPWVIRYLEIIANITEVDIKPSELPDDPLTLAYLAAYLLQVPTDQKQDLLSVNQSKELLERIRYLYRLEMALMGSLLAERTSYSQQPFSKN